MRRTVMIVSADAPVRWLHEGDTLDGGSVVPGFVCAVSDIFEGIARERPPNARRSKGRSREGVGDVHNA